MTRNARRLLKALRLLNHVTPLQVRMAATILGCNGLEEALQYTAALRAGCQYRLPLD